MAFESQIHKTQLDDRFYYEPMLSGLPKAKLSANFELGGKIMQYPIWISSMTGGTELANTINKRLATVCGKFGLGMGLGSCRQLLDSDEYFNDFDVRSLMPDQPLFANLGIAQIEQLIEKGETEKIDRLIEKLSADGLIVHVNPLQEWLQPEGDEINHIPIETIQKLLSKVTCPIIVKEVGQGFGKASLKALLSMPLEAIDFASNGGTNFSKIELFRSNPMQQALFEKIANLGHSSNEMIDWTNSLVDDVAIQSKKVIISGGIKDFLDGYYAIQKCKLNSIYGMASGFLKHALESQEAVDTFTKLQIEGLEVAHAFLRIKE